MKAAVRERWRFWAAVALIAAVAIALRVYAIDRLPPGLFGDEAVEGLDALDVLAGNLAIWFHAHLGREPLFVYLVALSYGAFGVSPLATRIPAIIAGLLTIPAAFLLTREWARSLFPDDRATRIALLTSALIAISFWHVEMSRNAHRDNLLPLVEAVGYWLLWRGLRRREWKSFAAAGAVLGLAVYTYSPGRFVGVFVAVFFNVELVITLVRRESVRSGPVLNGRSQSAGIGNARDPETRELAPERLEPLAVDWRAVLVAGLVAVVVMLPLAVYFAENPAQFSRRFESVSVFDFPAPALAFASSVVGNLAQFVAPGAGYESTHYNLPGKPVFDPFVVLWFLGGLVVAAAGIRKPGLRFMLLWFIVMLTPAFLTADMVPKGVRVFGVVPGVFVFPALAMDWLWARNANVRELRETRSSSAAAGERARTAGARAPNAGPIAALGSNRSMIVAGLIGVTLFGSAALTTYDYFVAWVGLPELPLAFDTDMVDVSDYIDRLPALQDAYVSTEVYRHPTFMLLGKHVPTTQYFDRSTRVREFDARTTLVAGSDASAPYIFVRDYAPPTEWLTRIAPQATLTGRSTYYTVYRLGILAAPEHAVADAPGPLLALIGYSRYAQDPAGIALYWRVEQLPTDRTDIQSTLILADVNGGTVTQGVHTFGVPPLEWASGDEFVEWYSFDSLPSDATQFLVQQVRGSTTWRSQRIPLD